jgi:hypothetical protein
MFDRFVASPPLWKPDVPLCPHLMAWHEVYNEIEGACAAKSQEACRHLGEVLSGSGVLTLDDAGQREGPHPLIYHVTTCHAVAESLLRDPREGSETALAEQVLAVSPPGGWAAKYFDLLRECFDDEGDLGLARDFAERAFKLAGDGHEDRKTLRSLFRLRDLLARAQSDGNPPALTHPLPDILTAVDIASALRVSLITVRRHLCDGSIPSRKFGRQRYVMKDDFLRVLQAKKNRRG